MTLRRGAGLSRRGAAGSASFAGDRGLRSKVRQCAIGVESEARRQKSEEERGGAFG